MKAFLINWFIWFVVATLSRIIFADEPAWKWMALVAIVIVAHGLTLAIDEIFKPQQAVKELKG